MKQKAADDWERIAALIQKQDPYGHLRSIHNCMAFYDYTRPWVTHCCIQRQDLYKTSGSSLTSGENSSASPLCWTSWRTRATLKKAGAVSPARK